MKLNPLKWNLHWQILTSLIGALLAGLYLLPNLAPSITQSSLSFSQFLGDVFMNALKMVIVPLIASSMIAGTIQVGSDSRIGVIGAKTFFYYIMSGLIAVMVGLTLVNLIQPGHVDQETAIALLGDASIMNSESNLLGKIEGRGQGDLLGIFKRMFPSNIFNAASDNGQLLGVIVFSILFGLCARQLPDSLRNSQSQFWESTQSVMLKITEYIIKFAPIGVFGLVLPIIYKAPIGDLLGTMTMFFLTVLIGLLIHLFIVLGFSLKFFAKINPIVHFKAMIPVFLTAFSTASSSATLPLTMDTVTTKSNISKKTSAFTLPLGATINMDGTALYECVVVLFISQLYASIGGVELSLVQQGLVVLLALTTSIGVAGIPSASLVAIAIILPVVGLPVEAIGVIWITDRILDMCRTSVNVFSDTVGAAIIARSEGEDIYPGQ